MKVLSLTERGKKALGVNDGESNRHGGPEHRYWVRAIAKHLKTQGYKVTEEVPVGSGKTIDIVATRNGKQLAFEIETGKSDAIANVRKCLSAGFEEITVVATSAHVRDKLRTTLPKHNSVTVLTTRELLEKNHRQQFEPAFLRR